MKKALITGHKGFIGQHLENALKLLNIETVGLDLKTGQNILSCSMPEADFCFHLAAQTDARCKDTQSDARINIQGTLRVLDYYGEGVIFASSSAVNYPNTPYAISKMAAENYVRIAGGRVVRLCNIYGRGGHGVIDKFNEADVLKINGIGDQIRTYAPVEDAVLALIEAVTKPPGSIIVLRGEDKTVLEVAKSLNKPRVHELPIPGDIQDGRQL